MAKELEEIVEPEPMLEGSAPAEPEAPDAVEGDGAPAATEEPAYTPNLKFKYTDAEKGDAEGEFEDWVKPIVNKDNEEKVRELYSKAYAVDFLKKGREKERTEKAALQQEYKQYHDTIQEILGLREKDVGLFLEKAGVPEQKVAQWLLQKLEAEEKLKDLPEPLRNMYNTNQELVRRTMELEKKLSNAQSGGNEAATRALDYQIQSVMAKPEISEVAARYDAARQKPGAFLEQVGREGLLEHSISGKDITAEEAVQRAIATLALQIQAPSQGVTPNGSVTQAPKAITTKPVVMPNVGSSTAAPTQKKPKTLDDIRRMAKEMKASNA